MASLGWRDACYPDSGGTSYMRISQLALVAGVTGFAVLLISCGGSGEHLTKGLTGGLTTSSGGSTGGSTTSSTSSTGGSSSGTTSSGSTTSTTTGGSST